MRNIVPAPLLHNVSGNVFVVNGNLYSNSGCIIDGKFRPPKRRLPFVDVGNGVVSQDNTISTPSSKQYIGLTIRADSGVSADCFTPLVDPTEDTSNVEYYHGFGGMPYSYHAFACSSLVPSIWTDKEGRKLSRIGKSFFDVTDPENWKLLEPNGSVTALNNVNPSGPVTGAVQLDTSSIIVSESDSEFLTLSCGYGYSGMSSSGSYFQHIEKDLSYRNVVNQTGLAGSQGAVQFICEVDGVKFFNTAYTPGSLGYTSSGQSETDYGIAEARSIVCQTDSPHATDTSRTNKLTLVKQDKTVEVVNGSRTNDYYPTNAFLNLYRYVTNKTVHAQYYTKAVSKSHFYEVSEQYVDIYYPLVDMQLSEVTSTNIAHVQLERFRYDRNSGEVTNEIFSSDNGAGSFVDLDLPQYDLTGEEFGNIGMNNESTYRFTQFINLSVGNIGSDGATYFTYVALPVSQYHLNTEIEKNKRSVLVTYKFTGTKLELVEAKSFKGCFASGDKYATGYVVSEDNNTICISSYNSISILKWSSVTNTFQHVGKVDIQPYSMYLNNSGELYVLDRDMSVSVVGKSNEQIVKIDYDENSVPQYDGTNLQEINVSLSVSDLVGNFVPSSVTLTLDGNCVFGMNGQANLEILTNDTSPVNVKVLLTGYGQINITSTKVETV